MLNKIIRQRKTWYNTATVFKTISIVFIFSSPTLPAKNDTMEIIIPNTYGAAINPIIGNFFFIYIPSFESYILNRIYSLNLYYTISHHRRKARHVHIKTDIVFELYFLIIFFQNFPE